MIFLCTNVEFTIAEVRLYSIFQQARMFSPFSATRDAPLQVRQVSRVDYETPHLHVHGAGV